MKRSILLATVFGLFVALLSGCKKDIQNNDAVKQGIMNYLSKRSDLLAMDVNVTNVAFHDKEATATVRFQAKGNSSPSAGMSMQYVMEQKNGQWVVKGRAGGDVHTGNPQGGAPGAPSGGATGGSSAMPGTPLGGGSGQSLPPGHPSVGGAAPEGNLPPGHPPIDSGKKK